MSLSAANAARIEAILDQPFLTDTLNTTYRELIDDNLIAYGRIGSNGKRNSYGIVLRSSVEEHYDMDSNHATYAEAIYYVPFFDAPKLLVDYLRDVEGIATVHRSEHRFDETTERWVESFDFMRNF